MKLLYCLSVFAISAVAFSQDDENKRKPITADRPDQTETPAIVPKGMFQMENGFSYEKTNDAESNFVTPSTLIKYGVNDNFELRLIAEYTTVQMSSDTISGFNPIKIGFKARLVEEHRLIPKIS